MRKIFVSTVLVAFFAVACSANKPESIDQLKQACLQATLKAIDWEIERHQTWLESAADTQEKKEKIENALQRLAEDKKRYENMPKAQYVLPERMSLTGKYAYTGAITDFEGQTRSGPFFNVIASARSLKVGKKYKFEFYPVYGQSTVNYYNSAYVYVSEAK